MSKNTTVETNPENSPARLIDVACDITAFCSTDHNRYALHGVHFTPNGIEATDGKIAIRVPYPGTPAEEFPKVPGVTDNLSPVLVQSGVLKDAIKGTMKKANLPVLTMARVSTWEDNGRRNIQLATTDLEKTNVIQAIPMDASFPSLDTVWPTEKPKFSITLGPDLLKRLADYASKHGLDLKDGPAIRFDFTDEVSPVRATVKLKDGRDAHALLCPMRMS